MVRTAGSVTQNAVSLKPYFGWSLGEPVKVKRKSRLWPN